MKVLALFATLALSVLAIGVDETYLDVLDSASVSSYRRMVIRNNLNIIQNHNADPHKTFIMKVNH